MFGRDARSSQLLMILNIYEERCELLLTDLIQEKWSIRPRLLFNQWQSGFMVYREHLGKTGCLQWNALFIQNKTKSAGTFRIVHLNGFR